MELSISLEGFKQLEAALARAPEIVTAELNAYAHAAVTHMVTEAQDRTPVDTGHLRSRISGEVLGTTRLGALGVKDAGVLGVVGTVTPYAIPVELGTRPHVIRAKNAKALHFGNITVKSVNHPGTKGAHMFQQAFDANQAQLHQDFERTVERILQRIAGGG